MSDLGINSAFAGRHWLRHHVPWLAAFAMLLGMMREGAVSGTDPDERIG